MQVMASSGVALPAAADSAPNPACNPAAGPWPNRVGYVARQPILDRRGGVFGYQLRFRNSVEAHLDGGPSGGSRALVDALALFGVERFTGGLPAFLACNEEMLLEELYAGLPSSRLVLEIPMPHAETPRLLRACCRLREAGFQLALSGFDPGRERSPFFRFADFIKMDGKHLDTPAWHSFCDQPAADGVTIVADNIHTHEACRTARTAGIKYFQGYYFCSPDLIPQKKIPANHRYHVEILRQLFKDPLDLKLLCPLVQQDASLIFRVLRFVNSPLCAMRQPVTSIESAIMLLGDAAFRRIATLAIHCGLNQDQSPELLNMALIRARFCAGAAPFLDLQPEEQYLLGMLSLLPPMLGVPMELILPDLPLRPSIRDAMAGVPVRERCFLSWIEELEHDRSPECDVIAEKYGLDKEVLLRLYLSSLEEANALAAAFAATA